MDHPQLTEARNLFYKALKDKKAIDAAIARFRELAQSTPSLASRVKAYTGALTGLKARDALWPHEKLSYVNQGLGLLDEALAESPDDLEVLFIHSSSCHHLPAFMGRAGQVQKSFAKIIKILPAVHSQYNRELVEDILNFLQNEAELDTQQKNTVLDMKTKLGIA